MAGGTRSRWRSKGWLGGSGAAVLGAVTTAILIVTLGSGDAPAAAPATTSVAPTTVAATATVPPTTVAPATTAAPTTVAPTTVAPTTVPPLSATRPTMAVERVVPTTVPPTTLPAQNAPINPPGDTHAQEPVIELGSIAIPAIGVHMTMYEGIRMTTLDRGPGHWPGSALPGAAGNVVVGGHRTSKHAVFRHVDDLVAGDEIIFTGGDGAQHVYVVSGIQIVDPSAVWIVEPTPTPQATLFACHPPGSTRERIIVFSDYRETIPAPTA